MHWWCLHYCSISKTKKVDFLLNGRTQCSLIQEISSSLSSRGFEKIKYISFMKGRIEKIGFKIFFSSALFCFYFLAIPLKNRNPLDKIHVQSRGKKSVCSDSSLMNRAWPVFFIWTQVQARLEDGLRTAANYVSTQYFVLMIGCFRHACFWRFLGLIISCRDTKQWEEIVFQGAFLFSWDVYEAWILPIMRTEETFCEKAWKYLKKFSFK